MPELVKPDVLQIILRNQSDTVSVWFLFILNNRKISTSKVYFSTNLVIIMKKRANILSTLTNNPFLSIQLTFAVIPSGNFIFFHWTHSLSHSNCILDLVTSISKIGALYCDACSTFHGTIQRPDLKNKCPSCTFSVSVIAVTIRTLNIIVYFGWAYVGQSWLRTIAWRRSADVCEFTWCAAPCTSKLWSGGGNTDTDAAIWSHDITFVGSNYKQTQYFGFLELRSTMYYHSWVIISEEY